MCKVETPKIIRQKIQNKSDIVWGSFIVQNNRGEKKIIDTW